MIKGVAWGIFLGMFLAAGRIHDDAPGDTTRNPWLRMPDGGRVIIHNMDTARSLIRRDTTRIDTARVDTSRTDTAKPPNRQGLFHWRGKVNGEIERMLEVRDDRFGPTQALVGQFRLKESVSP